MTVMTAPRSWRRVGPRGVVRTADRGFLIPTAAFELLRAANSPGQ